MGNTEKCVSLPCVLDLMSRWCLMSLERAFTSCDDSVGPNSLTPCAWLEAVPKAKKIRRDIFLGLI